MVNSLSTVIPLGSKSEYDYAPIHPGQYERNYHHNPNRERDGDTKGIWRRIQALEWFKRNPFRSYKRFQHNLCSNKRWSRLPARDGNQSNRRFGRANRHNKNNNNQCYYYILIYLLTIGLPVRAADDTYNNAAPSSTATGNVTNQAVQFQNNGAPSRQTMGKLSVSCNGPTMTFSPFWLASENKPYDPESYARGWNYGAQLNFMVPLNGSLTEQCKSMAIRLEETLRLEYELTRVSRCAELLKKGFTLREGSSFEHLCHDVVPIVLQPIKVKVNTTNYDDHPN